MGWWSEGEQVNKKDLLWGDPPADIMGDAIDHVIVSYLQDLRRLPTREEIRRGLEFSLRAIALREDMPGQEFTDEELKVIDDRGYTAFGEDLKYSGKALPQRNAYSAVLDAVRNLQLAESAGRPELTDRPKEDT